MVIAKKIILKKLFSGAPKSDNFELLEEQLAELKNGGNYYISFGGTYV